MHALTIITHLLEDVAEKPERLARAQQLAHEQVGPLFDHVVEDCAAICEREADATDGRLPDATGGRFAKKFAANCLRGAAATIRKTLRDYSRLRTYSSGPISGKPSEGSSCAFSPWSAM